MWRPEPAETADRGDQLAEIRRLRGHLANLLASGEYHSVIETAGDAPYRIAHSIAAMGDTAIAGPWLAAQLGLLTDIYSARLGIGDLDRARNVGQEIKQVADILDRVTVTHIRAGTCLHDNWSPDGSCVAKPPCHATADRRNAHRKPTHVARRNRHSQYNSARGADRGGRSQIGLDRPVLSRLLACRGSRQTSRRSQACLDNLGGEGVLDRGRR
jgi:hypothetical protein